ncbi:MAG: metallophosphoesterase [Ruminococcus sp.]|nr:metallophosphoesterase [Ruminococcus sp.]
MSNKFLKSLVIFSAGYIFLENRFMLDTRREFIGKTNENSIKIAHISDLHKNRFGDNNSRICRILRRENPDIIFITGDLVSRDETDFSGMKIFLGNLKKTAPVFMIYGNHEQSLPGNLRNEFKETVKNTGIILLENNSVNLKIKDRIFNIYGLRENYEVYKKDGKYRNLEKITPEMLYSLLGNPTENDNTILLAHNPLFAEAYAEWGADYTFSGHVHGGLIRIFGKGILSPERKFFPEYSKGIYKTGNMRLCVSGGLGKIRLFNPPEIVIYNL